MWCGQEQERGFDEGVQKWFRYHAGTDIVHECDKVECPCGEEGLRWRKPQTRKGDWRLEQSIGGVVKNHVLLCRQSRFLDEP